MGKFDVITKNGNELAGSSKIPKLIDEILQVIDEHAKNAALLTDNSAKISNNTV